MTEEQKDIQCEEHSDKFVAALYDKDSFLCGQCLNEHDYAEDQFAFFQDFIKDNFEISQTLGEGAYGVVFKAIGKIDRKPYALKVMKDFVLKQTEIRDTIVDELKAHAALNHKYILKFK